MAEGQTFYCEAIRVWDLKTTRQLLTLDSPYGHVHALDLSPDGQVLISAARGAASLWETSRDSTR